MKKAVAMGIISIFFLMTAVAAPVNGARSQVLLYWGNGGVGPATEAGPVTDYYKAKAFIESLGYIVDYTDVWPTDLNTLYQAIFLLAPGHASGDNVAVDGFTSGQVTQLDEYVRGGGRLVVITDHSAFTGQTVENDLLTKLIGGNIQFKSQSIANALANFISPTSTYLTYGILALDFDQATGTTVAAAATPGQLAMLNSSHSTNPKETILAADMLGDGLVVTIGDLNWMDDIRWISDFDWPYDNEKLLYNIVGRREVPEVPQPVGGTVVEVDKIAILKPYLAFVLVGVVSAVVVARTRRLIRA